MPCPSIDLQCPVVGGWLSLEVHTLQLRFRRAGSSSQNLERQGEAGKGDRCPPQHSMKLELGEKEV
jgi:hypothetical protein